MIKKYFFLSLFLTFFIGAFLGALYLQPIILPERSPQLGDKTPVYPAPPQPPPIIQGLCQKIQTGKGVEVDISQQVLRMCEGGRVIEEMSVSTGRKETPTPVGSFRVISKKPMLYSRLANSWLPFWVGIYSDYGFHETPISRDEEKRIGEDEIGQPTSMGCVRLRVGDAERFYHWAEIGMRVIIY